MYFRSLTLPERAAYESVVREWFPNIGIFWRYELEYPGYPNGAQDTYDNTIWTYSKNGVTVTDNYLYTYVMVNYEGDPGTFAFTPEEYRDNVKTFVMGDARLFAPMLSDTPPSGLSGDPSGGGVAFVGGAPPVARQGAPVAMAPPPVVRMPNARQHTPRPPPWPAPGSTAAHVAAMLRAAPPGSTGRFAVDFPVGPRR